MKPSVGRMVHYVSTDRHAPCQAAVVTEVTPGSGTILPETVSLTVLGPGAIWQRQGIRQDETGRRGGTWHWPERVPE